MSSVGRQGQAIRHSLLEASISDEADRAQPSLALVRENCVLVPKVAETLHVLIERHGKVVEKAELMRLVWPDAVVEAVGLARNISLLRKALGDESAEIPVIETVPKRGYRFAAEVRVDGMIVGGW